MVYTRDNRLLKYTKTCYALVSYNIIMNKSIIQNLLLLLFIVIIYYYTPNKIAFLYIK